MTPTQEQKALIEEAQSAAETMFSLSGRVGWKGASTHTRGIIDSTGGLLRRLASALQSAIDGREGAEGETLSKEPEPVPVPLLAWDRVKVCRAAEAANASYQQWMPERWLHLFMDHYEGKR